MVDLVWSVDDEMAAGRFDVAPIAAAGMAIPLAAHAKRLGTIGVSPGGMLQVRFGVIGKRWRENRRLREHYVDQA